MLVSYCRGDHVLLQDNIPPKDIYFPPNINTTKKKIIAYEKWKYQEHSDNHKVNNIPTDDKYLITIQMIITVFSKRVC